MFPFTMPVDWQDPEDVELDSPLLEDWLLNTGSLTERLQALTTRFKVSLLGQEALELDGSEQRLLPNHAQQDWEIREVILHGARSHQNNSSTQDWVFARSVLPQALCRSEWANLGNQPLGSRIFNDDNFTRSAFEIGKLRFHPLSKAGFETNQSCWARRSKFTIAHYELIVAEAFLPDSPCYW
jgi:chorismate--pyruvate lyase